MQANVLVTRLLCTLLPPYVDREDKETVCLYTNSYMWSHIDAIILKRYDEY